MNLENYLDRLERADAEGSPSPWCSNSYSRVISGPLVKADADGDDLPDYYDQDAPADQRTAAYEKESTVCVVPAMFGDTSQGRHRKDMELITASRNASPTLVKMVRVCDEILRTVIAGDGVYSADPLTFAKNCCDEMERAARDGLDKLQSILDESEAT